MDIGEFNEYLRSLPGKVMDAVPDIVAETAVEYYKDTFRKKAFGSDIWVQGKPKRSGSLLVQSGALLNSIQPVEVSAQRVVIAAGNAHVPYAQVHNEGYEGTQTVVKKGRKGKKTLTGSDIFTRHVRMPRRQFMGYNEELGGIIGRNIGSYLDSVL